MSTNDTQAPAVEQQPVVGNSEKFKAQLEKLFAEGWRAVPGTFASGLGQHGISQFVCVVERAKPGGGN